LVAHLVAQVAMPRRALAWSVNESGQEVRRKDPTRLEQALEQGRSGEARSDASERNVDVHQKRKERILQALKKVSEAQAELMVVRDVLHHVESGEMLAVVPTETRAEERRGSSEEAAAVEEVELGKQMAEAASKLRRSAKNMRRRVNKKNHFYEDMERLQKIWKLLKTTDGNLTFDTGYVSRCRHNRIFPVRRGPQGRVQVFDVRQLKARSNGSDDAPSTNQEGYEYVDEVLRIEQDRVYACMLQDELETECMEDPSLYPQRQPPTPRNGANSENPCVRASVHQDVHIEREFTNLLRRRIRKDLGVRVEAGPDAVYPAIKELREQNNAVTNNLSTVEGAIRQLPPCQLHLMRSNSKKATIKLSWPNPAWIAITVNCSRISVTGGESKSWVATVLQLFDLKATIIMLFAVQNLAKLEADLLSMGHTCALERFELSVFAHGRNLAVRPDMDALDNGHLIWIIEDIEKNKVIETVPGIRTDALILRFLFKRVCYLVDSTE